MDLSDLFQNFQESLGATLPGILGALAILLVGWLVAVVVRAAVRKALGLIRLDERLGKVSESSMRLERGVAQGAFLLVMAFVLLAFFNALELGAVSSSLQTLVDQILGFAPKAIAGGALLLVAWIVAVVVRSVVTKGLGATSLDRKVSTEGDVKPVSQSLGTAGFWLTILLFLPGVLGALELEGLLGPVQGMVDQILGLVPKILAAAAIGLVGWFLARIVREVVTNLLAAAGVDQVGARAGLKSVKISALVGLLLYVFILVPAVIAALNALEVEAISTPATEMLSAVLAAVPDVFAAAAILAVSWFVALLVSSVVTSLLAAAGFDGIPAKLGLAQAFGEGGKLSRFAGKLVVFFVMLFAATEAAARLGFDQVSGFVTTMTAFGGQVLLGSAIIGVGLWLSNLARKALETSASRMTASVVRFAILGIVFAMGLRAMGLADEIVNLAFGLTLGAIAVAAALAFGLGGRETAGKQLARWFERSASGSAPSMPQKSGRPSPLEH